MYLAVGMCVSQLLVAILGTTTTGQYPTTGLTYSKNDSAQKASIAFVCIYIFFFASTWGPIAVSTPSFFLLHLPLPVMYHLIYSKSSLHILRMGISHPLLGGFLFRKSSRI